MECIAMDIDAVAMTLYAPPHRQATSHYYSWLDCLMFLARVLCLLTHLLMGWPLLSGPPLLSRQANHGYDMPCPTNNRPNLHNVIGSHMRSRCWLLQWSAAGTNCVGSGPCQSNRFS